MSKLRKSLSDADPEVSRQFIELLKSNQSNDKGKKRKKPSTSTRGAQSNSGRQGKTRQR